MKKIIITVIISVAIVTFLLGFIEFGSSSLMANTDDVTYSINSIPEEYVKVGSMTTREQDIICAISKGLIEIDMDGNIQPALAESVNISDNGIQYDFTIRNDVYWSNGEKITAKDIVMFFRQVLTEESEESISALLNVYGAEEYRNSNVNFNDIVAISAKDNVITFRLNTSDDNFLYELSKPQYRLRQDVILWDNLNNRYDKFAYSGEYGIFSMNENEIILCKNTFYNNSLPEIIRIVKDESEDSALAAFEIGNRDIVINPPRTQLERLKDEDKIITVPSNEGVYLCFNVNDEFIPVEGRKTIYSYITKALQEYADSNPSCMIMSNLSYYRDDDDLSKLQERKVNSKENNEDSTLPDTITLVIEENVSNKELANILTSWFEKNTEIILITKLVEAEEIDDVILMGNYDISLVDFKAAIEDNTELIEVALQYIPNLTLEVWSSEEDTLEDQLFNNYSLLPLVFYNENIAINNKIKSVSLDSHGNMRFGTLEINY